MGQSRPLCVYFRPFLMTISIIDIEKSVDVVLVIQTRGRRIVGTDKSTELWRPPVYPLCICMTQLIIGKPSRCVSVTWTKSILTKRASLLNVYVHTLLVDFLTLYYICKEKIASRKSLCQFV